MLLDFRKPNCVIQKEEKSYSGKYKVYFGHHYVNAKMCFDVGAINQENGEITTRHYNETADGGATQAKAEALRVFHELVKGMKRKPDAEEKQDNNPFLMHEYRQQLKRGLS